MTNAQPEPSMEEILASIRRIISEDEEEQPGVDRESLEALANTVQEEEEDAAPSLGVVETPQQPSESDLHITRMLDQAQAKRDEPNEEAETPSASEVLAEMEHIDQETLSSETDAPEVENETNKDEAAPRLETEDIKMVKQQAAAHAVDDTIIDNTTASAASAAFGNLTRSVRVSQDDGQTLESIVVEMMRPLVKEWLDDNLSRIVEQKVEDEVQRLSRRG